MEQSIVGKVLSSWLIRPPMLGPRSTKWTFTRASARSSAAWMPAMPPPNTRTPKDSLGAAAGSASLANWFSCSFAEGIVTTFERLYI